MMNFRSPPELTARLDAWIAARPEPRPSRSEAIRRILAEALTKPEEAASPPSDATLDRQIAKKEAAIDEIPEHAEPSPEAALATMDKALAENELIDMKNKRTRRKMAKRAQQKPPA
jgi:Arc/MetJ-type ribon-helix-helix transcriptional regulator